MFGLGACESEASASRHSLVRCVGFRCTDGTDDDYDGHKPVVADLRCWMKDGNGEKEMKVVNPMYPSWNHPTMNI